MTMGSPSSPTESELPGTSHHDSDGQDMPRGNVLEWSVDEVADYIDSLGLGQYHEMFLGMCFLNCCGCMLTEGLLNFY